MRILPTLVLALLLAAAVPPPSGGSTPGPAPPGFVVYAAPEDFPSVGAAGEPSVGASWATGSVFLQSFTQTYRARFDDSVSPPAVTWDNVGKGPQTLLNVDPILFTDSASGRTYAGGLDGQCSILGVTDDDGATWQPVGNACASPAFDHETIGAGPWREPRPATARFGQAVYYCAQLQVAQCARSDDGGLTFGPAVPVPCSAPNPGLHGSVHVGPDGYVYLPFKRCGGSNGLAISPNNGLTWTTRQIPGAPSASAGFDPDVATTPSGWAWVAYPTTGFGPGVALTKDHGATWANFGDVAFGAGVRSSTFHEMVAGDDGRAAIAYLGSATDGNPFNAAFAGTWDLYVSFTFDEGATWETVKATSDPVQRGWVCASGTTCTTGRNLLDFIDATVDADGRVVVGFADGCVSVCADASGTPAQSGAAWATLARQACGPSLFAAKGDVNGGAACPAGGATLPAPQRLSGAYYATGLVPVGTADAVLAVALPEAGATLTPVPPAGLAPKAAPNGAGQGGSNAGTIYDAHWFLPAPTEGFALSGQDVTVRLWVTGGGQGTLRVALFDAHATTFAAVNASIASATVPVPLAPTPTEVVVTFPDLTATFAQGLELFVAGPAQGDVQVLYDAVDTPTRIEFE